jgi:hypothetical protein
MSLLSNLKSDDSIAGERDSVGGNGPIDSGLYLCKVALAYLTKAASGAVGLVLSLKTDTGKEIRQTVYMTSGTAKGGTNYYTDKDGAKQYLPGFLVANSLALLTVGKEISDLDTETKVVNAYSPEAKAEVPTKVEMLVELLGKDILVGLIKQVVDKTKKNDAGVYEATGETKEENEIDKLFRARDRMTTAEIRAKAEAAAFAATWEAKNAGNVRNKSKAASASSGVAGAPKAATTAKPKASLFA